MTGWTPWCALGQRHGLYPGLTRWSPQVTTRSTVRPSPSHTVSTLEVEYSEYPPPILSLPAKPAAYSGGSGNTHGQIAMLDLRKGLVRGCLKGLVSEVAAVSPSRRCGVLRPDRFLRIHGLEDRKLQYKVYLKSIDSTVSC
ncbi:WD repeat-containing protein 74 [Lates japonicus]|uniref:WD repeat-containing protein 74 n=1 Tax=Lates japonicus TaxID=270547 RepID=A0AAD3REP7_LATJO|nr:WD repeat-containing protein 74 [Lates japonicus]